MKNLNYIINAVLAVAIIVLFVLFFTNNKKEDTTNQTMVSDAVLQQQLPIAYINIDSLLMNYNYAKDLNEALLRRQENARATINEKGRALEKDGAEFQRKVQNNAFLSRERAEQDQARLMKKEQELRELEQRLSNELMGEQQKMNIQLSEAINTFVKEYNKTKKYQVIFSSTVGGNILTANPIYNITTEITELLNAKYNNNVEKK